MAINWRYAAAAAMVVVGGVQVPSAQAQERALREVTLSASAEQQVAQDWLRMRMAARIEGRDASAVQAQLKQAIERALAQVQPMASGAALQVRTDGFNLQPRYTQQGRTDGWVGQAGVVIEGRDFGLIGQASAKLAELNADQVALSVSSELARRTSEQVRLEAISAFRAQALAVAKAFGHQSYELMDVNVGSDNGGARPPVLMARAMAMSSDAAAVPVAASVESIGVQVSGRIRLQ
jgi:predicted secreted protein